ncbi:hypothetical protein RHGRI_037484 [Rhododendron griersonianum]|uniref:Uncharacterized protein n=1 Tax=Rhododendron griersonianum TaxID=479676 RepID=A0AAV6HXI9_9ERIC|nr:hypothetical protein RHGRI_037484 [Rhododendron griersonianum]
MGWLTKIMKGSSHKISEGQYQAKYGDERIWVGPSTTDAWSDFETEDVEHAIALSLVEEDEKGKKGLHSNSVAEHCETLKAQAYRDAPTLLEYASSYKGVLRKKTKKKEEEPIVKKKAGPSETQGAGRGQKLPRVKLPTFRKPADYWFGLENESPRWRQSLGGSSARPTLDLMGGVDDSIKVEPGLAVTLLRGLALPKDVEQVPSELVLNFVEMCSHLVVQVGQAALKAYDKVTKVGAEREHYKSDQDTARQKKMEEKEKVKAADLKGYMAGINRAAKEYTKVARDIVNDELKLRLPDFYKLGYQAGAVAMVGVMVIELGTGFLNQLPAPMVPELDLPYTAEEWEPLPLEEDDEEGGAKATAEEQGESSGAELGKSG